MYLDQRPWRLLPPKNFPRIDGGVAGPLKAQSVEVEAGIT